MVEVYNNVSLSTPPRQTAGGPYTYRITRDPLYRIVGVEGVSKIILFYNCKKKKKKIIPFMYFFLIVSFIPSFCNQLANLHHKLHTQFDS